MTGPPTALNEPDQAETTAELRWRPSGYARALAAVAAIGVLGALLGRTQALLVAVPAMVALALADPRRTARRLTAHLTYGTRRCVEGEDVPLSITIDTDGPVERCTVRLDVPDGAEIVTGEPIQPGDRAAWTLRFHRWGRHRPGRIGIDLTTAGHTRAARVELSPGEIAVYPAPGRLRDVLPHQELLARAGEHIAAATGAGVEFLGIRPYQPGDPPRAINRAVTARTGRLHINQRAAQRATDLVIVIDAMSDPGPPGATSLDLAVRAAATLARGYLRHADRVGAVALGGIPHWLAPGIGAGHLYRIADTVLSARRIDSVVSPNLDRIPRTALPPRAYAVVFSPLLDDRAIAAITDLHRRGHPVAVLDTLTTEPPTDRSQTAELALRLWRLDRAALRTHLAERGIPVIDLRQPGGLDAVITRLRPHHRTATRRAAGPKARLRDAEPGAAEWRRA